MEIVTVRKVKRPRGGTTWKAYVLGEDEHGIWLHCPKGSVHHFPTGGTWTVPCDAVQLLPTAGWWVAWWWDDPAGRWIGVDVCTPASLSNAGWMYVDLELDPVGNEEGFVRLVDEDEFEEACRTGVIPPKEQEIARRAASEIEMAMTALREPFGRAGWDRLDAVAGQRLVPLMDNPGVAQSARSDKRG